MKCLLIFLTLCIACLNGYGGPSFGIKGGFVYANQDIHYIDNTHQMKSNYKFGTTFGIFLEWLNHPALHLVSEIYYIQKGMNEISDLTSPNGEIIETYTYKHHVDYISFPITLKLQTGLRHNLLYIKAGPRMDLKIGHKTQYMELIYKEFEYMVFGTDICAGIEREIESGVSFLLELCYNHDFKKAYKTNVIQIKNRSFSLVFGLKL